MRNVSALLKFEVKCFQIATMKLKQLVLKRFVAISKQTNQKMQTFKCKYCTETYAKHTTRMSLHLIKCRGCPDNIKSFVRDQMNFEETETKVLKRKRENSLNDMTLNESSVDSVEEINSNTSIASQ